MHEMILSPGRDTLLVGILFAFLLLLNVFRLDGALATPKEAMNRRRRVCGMNEAGESILRDPDGRVVKARHPRRVRQGSQCIQVADSGPAAKLAGQK
jgi:hypothetical protein